MVKVNIEVYFFLWWSSEGEKKKSQKESNNRSIRFCCMWTKRQRWFLMTFRSPLCNQYYFLFFSLSLSLSLSLYYVRASLRIAAFVCWRFHCQETFSVFTVVLIDDAIIVFLQVIVASHKNATMSQLFGFQMWENSWQMAWVLFFSLWRIWQSVRT
jgi:hypothetical protein